MEVDVTIGLAFLAGFVSFISPCVLPLVPAYIGYMSARVTNTVAAQVTVGGGTAAMTRPTAATRFSTFLHGLAFVTGFTIVFVLVGIITTAFLLQVTDVLARIGGLVIIFFGLHFMGIMPSLFERVRAEKSRAADMAIVLGLALGGTLILVWGIVGSRGFNNPALLWELSPWMPVVAGILVVMLWVMMFLGGAFTEPHTFLVKLTNTIEQGLYSDTRRQMTAEGSNGLLGSGFMGVAFAAGWTPCIGPIFAAILNMAAVTGEIGRAVPLLVAYSLGLGFPFLMAALLLDSTQGFLRRLNRHMRQIKIASGALLIFIGVLMATERMQTLSQDLARQFADFSYRVEECVAGMGQGQISPGQFFDCAGGTIEIDPLP